MADEVTPATVAQHDPLGVPQRRQAPAQDQAPEERGEGEDRCRYRDDARR
jgi:hypothetical protein